MYRSGDVPDLWTVRGEWVRGQFFHGHHAQKPRWGRPFARGPRPALALSRPAAPAGGAARVRVCGGRGRQRHLATAQKGGEAGGAEKRARTVLGVFTPRRARDAPRGWGPVPPPLAAHKSDAHRRPSPSA